MQNKKVISFMWQTLFFAPQFLTFYPQSRSKNALLSTDKGAFFE